ncbi:D-lactate dehydrogenase (cytochrome) [Oleidesulfovibrio alaskensis G20]|jgi:glycolate oxidase|uniref:D-lactate dehydrogenase (Cytochrome) n=1 Tax=Oleidesulfovibrio alaskensis (strain ATCC BAA-1058 / DSM 17464 / G20) TaxID=207559 RepID=Q30WB3_OLEA2|nr:FAD-linked oxidase C-terminal domain-containing protein [Oleidesulfovibrio alaskensis]ABB40033.1 D-lactate dehydrogenase (cytochrome) [Oleidesulfovibrio alaskensis G20]MBG0773290.1 FAD-binding protein [Oleidesulfovibrio alaskensis]MBL3581449.1 FAD-binding protein [Oleidesulfovibrio alaskensis]
MLSESLIKEFKTIVGDENVFDNEADRQCYSYDSAVLDAVVPALVVRPTETTQIGQVVKLCNENGLPITVRGAGTNLSGGTIPDPRDGVVVLTNGLTKILEINEQDLYAVVQPGVVTAKFAAEVAKRGLFYPPDPGSQAVSTIAGNVAENAGGLRGLKYGVTKDYVMGIEFYDVNGGLVKTGSRTVKCVTGYNLAGLMAASEGTLGVFSEIILKLVPPPRASKAMMAVFDDINKASEAVAGIIAAHVVPCTLEFMDQASIRYVEDYTKAGLPVHAEAILLIEVDGHPGQVEDDAARVEQVLKSTGAEIQVAKDAEEKFKLWEARRNALPALARAKPTTVLEDATVPRSQIPAMVKAINDIAAKYQINIGTFGHAGDGNLHPTILCDRRDKKEFERVEHAVDEIFDVALSLKGTLSGEHGIGMAKSKWMEKETSRATIDFSLNMKRAIDPNNILNPGKIIGG